MMDIETIKIKIKEICDEIFDLIIESILPRWLPLMFVLSIILLFVLQKYISFIEILISTINEFIITNIFKPSLLSSLMEVPIVMLGIYITIISVFGIGFSRATIIISKDGLAKRFIKYTQISIISAIIFLIGTITYDLFSSKLWTFLYLNLLLWCFANFIRFIAITMKMYSINIEEANKEAESSEELLVSLNKKINILLDDKQNSMFEDDNYFNKINSLNEKMSQESSAKNK